DSRITTVRLAFSSSRNRHPRHLHSFPTRRSSDLIKIDAEGFDLPILETLGDLVRSQRPFLQVEMFSLRKSTTAYRLGLYDFLVRDRKSTRLNSSHLGISYAVFCLKKKITTSNQIV